MLEAREPTPVYRENNGLKFGVIDSVTPSSTAGLPVECPGGATRWGELDRMDWLWIDLAVYRHREVPNIVRNTCAARVDLMFVPRMFIATSSAFGHYSTRTWGRGKGGA
ncbi:hypothetical protein FA13DRAFT_1916955 [Coprinellus micaceus]|uniref:Uncharacterized protein n=1 Tax=Coprinellus micaceus TaxID=71717 RepID=A0A4Y7SMQ9_COPMI|nr:hypothetical protein FA13DRAFT_1916955 [Coprinellus micaceus]